MRAYLVLAVAIVIGFSLLDSAESSPINNKNNQSHDEFSKTYGSGYESVWKSVVQTFEQNNIPIKSIDKDSGIIVSQEKSLTPKDQTHRGILNADDFDCGKPGTFKHFSKTTGTITVVVKNRIREGLTTVKVEASGKTLARDYAGFREQWQQCSSTGVFEEKFLELQSRNKISLKNVAIDQVNLARGEDVDDLEESASKPTVKDPLEGLNRFVFKINDKLYFWAIKPLATVYSAFIPLGVRTAIDNAEKNFEFPARFANCVLQRKGDKACVETERVLINSTLGVGGLFDFAQTGFGISRPSDEDFGQTLAVWGVNSGPFLMLPVLGPSDTRDVFGYAVDHTALDPLFWVTTPTWIPYMLKSEKIVNSASLRGGMYEDLKKAALDPYVSLRDAYMQRRESEIKQ